jgi:hypothetical protein
MLGHATNKIVGHTNVQRTAEMYSVPPMRLASI